MKKKIKIVELNNTEKENEEEVVEVKSKWNWKKIAVIGGSALAVVVGGIWALGRKKPTENPYDGCEDLDTPEEEELTTETETVENDVE